MTWRRYLQLKTRDPAFLWRMGLGILAAGVVVGLAVDWAMPSWVESPTEASLEPGASDAWWQLHRLAEQSQWAALWWRLAPMLAVRLTDAPGQTALGVLTGLAWLAFCLQAVQVRSWRDLRLIAPLAGIVLGMLSIWLTMFFILWQQYAWGLIESDGLIDGLRYNILGIGLREESAKLLCFLPLLPWLAWRRDELAALVSGGCVGIGFGIVENIGYIGSTMAVATMGRLLTATPAHMAMTGLVGLAAYRACRQPRECGPPFLATFITIVLAHGFYDAFIQLPALEHYSMGSAVIFVLLVFQFFRELRPHLKRRGEPVSLTANFLACVAVVAAANFVYLCAAVGWRLAGEAVGQAIVAQGIMVYLFLREMPE